jgi:hypothetical protein
LQRTECWQLLVVHRCFGCGSVGNSWGTWERFRISIAGVERWDKGLFGAHKNLGLLVLVECDRHCYSKYHLNSMSVFSRICYGAWTIVMVEFSVIFLLFFFIRTVPGNVKLSIQVQSNHETYVGKMESPSRPHCLT